jgi:hypothetical protein
MLVLPVVATVGCIHAGSWFRDGYHLEIHRLLGTATHLLPTRAMPTCPESLRGLHAHLFRASGRLMHLETSYPMTSLDRGGDIW